MKMFANKELPLWAFVPVGFITGTLNMIVGVIAPILGVLVIRKELSKEKIVGTLGFFGLIGNLLKITGFSLVGFSTLQYAPTILCMALAGIIGTRVGRSVLSNLDERYFLIGFRIMLLVLALKLMIYDGLSYLWI